MAGLSVQRPVEEELKRRREIVTIYHTIVSGVKTVRERSRRKESVTLKAVIKVSNHRISQEFIFHKIHFAFLNYTFPNFPGPVDGGWGEWKTWTKCTKSCGGGKTERTRRCDSPKPAHGGKYCMGHPYQTRDCGEVKCKLF